MEETFDEAYATYRRFLAKLDTTYDLTEKNDLFKQLAEQLSRLELKLKQNHRALQCERHNLDGGDSTFAI